MSCNRGHWRPAEDEKLRRLVDEHGPQNWNLIAEKLEGRSGKSCRLRWYNQLDPRITKKPFTSDEEERLLQAHKLHGNKWASIARFFPGRTDNAVKNHYHVIMARRKRDHHHHHHLPFLIGRQRITRRRQDHDLDHRRRNEERLGFTSLKNPSSCIKNSSTLVLASDQDHVKPDSPRFRDDQESCPNSWILIKNPNNLASQDHHRRLLKNPSFSCVAKNPNHLRSRDHDRDDDLCCNGDDDGSNCEEVKARSCSFLEGELQKSAHVSRLQLHQEGNNAKDNSDHHFIDFLGVGIS